MRQDTNTIKQCVAVLSICIAICWIHAAEITIHVKVPARKPSRPAHFNWVFQSSGKQPPQVGQFACGSYWIAPAPGEDTVVLRSLTGNPANQGKAADLLSCDIDPVTEKHGLLSGQNHYGNYDPAENILPHLPMPLQAPRGSCLSLVAAMQRNEAVTSKGGTRLIVGEVADAYCVVTVLPSVPPEGGRNMLRPNITGMHKELLTWDDFDLSRLPAYDFIPRRSEAEWETVATRWRHATEIFGISVLRKTKRGPRFTTFSEGGRAFRAHLLIPNYGSGMAQVFNNDVLHLLAPGSFTPGKKKALAAIISFGLDLFHARYDRAPDAPPAAWSSGAGQSMGKFLPPVLVAALRRDESMAHRLRKAALTVHDPDPAMRGPQELRQIRRGLTGVLLWGDGHPFIRPKGALCEMDWRYWGELVGGHNYDGYCGKLKPTTRVGKKTTADPYGYIDGPGARPGAAYMGVTAGCFRSFAAAMILIPAVRSVVNCDDPIEYADRLTRHGLWTWPDPVAPFPVRPHAANPDVATAG
ncbi:MAG: hypothetical protein D6820_12595, partial [Lentisphaerae bacterium]